jgi:hypothetical protein
MTWDPAVLRRYNTTGHFRLLNQVRTELRGNPLIRPKDGETVGAANRSRSLTRAIENRAQAGYGRSRRAAAAVEVVLATPEQRREALLESMDSSGPASAGVGPGEGSGRAVGGWQSGGSFASGEDPGSGEGGASFRSRLNAIELR